MGYLDWTFFSRRVKKNPSFYGVKSSSQGDVFEFMFETARKSIFKLKDHECISLTDENDVGTTSFGLSASKFYLDFKTPKKMFLGVQAAMNLLKKEIDGNDVHNEVKSETPPSSSSNSFSFPKAIEEMGVSSIFFAIAHTPEFDEVPVRHNEDQLITDFSEKLPWGAQSPIAPSIIANWSAFKQNTDELMGDPHTK